LFLRARAKDMSGQTDGAIADYSLAARTALAKAQDLSSGDGHLYRGIMLYRRKDFARAEDEFSSALNFAIPAELRADAVAWRRMAAVAGGSCAGGRHYLEEALPQASPWFPADEARTLMAACQSSSRVATPRGDLR
jgi:tetratricopeptide (TPR) repeat protein